MSAEKESTRFQATGLEPGAVSKGWGSLVLLSYRLAWVVNVKKA
jgi:hypothetical protein